MRQAEVASTEADAMAGAGSTPLPQSPTKEAWSNERLLPVERLSKLDVDADLTFGQLTLEKLPIHNAVLKATGQGGLLTLSSLRGDLYEGNFEAKGTLDVRQQAPVLNLQTQISRVPAEKILESQGKKPPVKGLVTLNSNLTGSGNSQKALIETLNGNASFVINNGVLLNANLEQQLCKGIATLNRKTLSGEPRGKDTPFQELKGNLTLRNGVASNPDLKVRIPGMTVNGDGDIDLRVLGMDYRVGHHRRRRQERHAGPGLPGRREICRHPVAAALPRPAGAGRQGLPPGQRTHGPGREPNWPASASAKRSTKNWATRSARNSKDALKGLFKR